MVKHKAPPKKVTASVIIDRPRGRKWPARPADASRLPADAVLEAVPYGLALIDRHGLIVRVNCELAAIVGREPSAMTGQHIDHFVAERFRDDPVIDWDRHVNDRAHRPLGSTTDIAVLHADGSEVPVQIGVSTVVGDREPFVIVAVNDISARVRLERQLRNANTELEQFANVASHDLKSPLRGVHDLVDWIAEDLGPDAPASVANNLARIQARVLRMQMLIDELLTYARLGRTADGYRSIDMHELIDRAIGLVAIPPSFTVTIDADLLPFAGSSTPLETVVRNLVSNAVKHNDHPDGSITIRARAQDDHCRIEVIDDGPGVPAFARQRIFRLFQTAHMQSDDNAGVGLAVCQRLCDANDAVIGIESEPGRGATFVVEWPLVSRRDARDA